MGRNPARWLAIHSRAVASEEQIGTSEPQLWEHTSVFKRFRINSDLRLIFAPFAAQLPLIIGFVFTGSIGITRFYIFRR